MVNKGYLSYGLTVEVSAIVAENNFVEKGQPLEESQTEKAVSKISIESSGTIQEIAVKRGDSAKVGDVLATIDPEGVSRKAAAD